VNVEDKRNRNLRRIERIDLALASESVDAIWSAEARTILLNKFQTGTLAGSSLVEAKCAFTFCRVKARHLDKEAQETFMLFAHRLGGMGGRTLFVPDAEGPSGYTVAYLIRSAHDSPAHPVRQRDPEAEARRAQQEPHDTEGG
jgi:hypothetical protein